MGCGESKHLAIGNTISRKSFKIGSRKAKSEKKTNSKEEANNIYQILGDDNAGRVVDDGKDIAESKELKKEPNVESEEEKKTGAVKENEEPVETVSGVGNSGNSELNSPQDEPVKDSLSNEMKPADASECEKLHEETKEEAVEDKKLAEETKEETVQETKPAEEAKEETNVVSVEPAEDAKKETVENQNLGVEEKEKTANGNAETVKEDNLGKETETETAKTTVAEVPAPVEKQEMIPAASPAEAIPAASPSEKFMAM